MARYSVNNYTVETLLSNIKSGSIAIPEMQRPFVWDSSKVRDLVDSLYKGFPVGYIIVWQNPDVKLKDGTKSSGKKILIDGQQRITAMAAAIVGQEVLDDHYKWKRISAVVHMDEKTPHMHLCFVPLTEDGRLSAKDIMGNKKKLTWWQDEFWKHMVKKFPDLERGESASLTGRDHIPPRVFKEMTRLTKQKSKLEDLLTGINPFNAKSRAEEICKILDTYIPSVEKMDTLLRKYGVAFTKTASENKKLKTKNAELEESLASAQKVSTLKQIEDLKLRRDYDSAVAILEQIPAEVLNIYAQSSHRGKERPIEQSL